MELKNNILTDVTRILIADDHAVVRAGVIKAVTGAFPNASIAEAANTSDVLKLLMVSEYDLLLLDISMPGRSGIDLLTDITKQYPSTKVIIFSMHPEDQFAIRSIRAGASAYVTKDTNLGELVEIMRKILRGQRHITPLVADLLFNEMSENGNKPIHQLLSQREFEVFQLIASGRSVSQIALDLSLSVKTISVYRSNILKKMNLKNNAEIMHYAFKHSIVD